MKLNRNNYEEWMFELLEGRVEEPLRSELMNQINEDGFLQSEWKLWQATILKAEPVVYEKKNQLTRKARIYPFYRYAAAACILFTLLFYFLVNKNNENLNDKVIANTDTHKSNTPRLPELPVYKSDSLKDNSKPAEIRNKRERVSTLVKNKIEKTSNEILTVTMSDQDEYPDLPISDQQLSLSSDTALFATKTDTKVLLAKSSGVRVSITESVDITNAGNDNKKGFFRKLMSPPKLKIEKDNSRKIPYKLTLENEGYILVAAY